ncbi:MAG: helix-turn-helix transcriptional regulator [Armatimonadetes bacterium]|nr:helix-turn-helix transcriptional regulator [Armatimonadota bacterium]
MLNNRGTLPLSDAGVEFGAAMLKLLGNPVRLRILELLEQTGSLAVGEIVERLSQPQPTISQHLGAMKARGLVSSIRQNGQVHYSIAQPQIHKLLECLRGCDPWA